MRFFFQFFLFFFLFTAFFEQKNVLSAAQNQYEARRELKKIVDSPVPVEKKERLKWAKSLMALISLERLSGSEEQALRYFERCENLCKQAVNKEEWSYSKAWACAAKPELGICVKG